MQRTLCSSSRPGRRARPRRESPARQSLRLCLGLVALLLALGAADPARAATTVDASNSPFIIDSPLTDSITVNLGGELDIVTGGALSKTIGSGEAAVHVEGGILL